MTPTTLQTLLEEHFADWVRALDLTVTKAAGGEVQLCMQPGPAVMRVGNIVSGQALAALADTAMVLAAVSHAGMFRAFATTDLHTQFLRPGTASPILCDAKIVRAGKSMVFARADMQQSETQKLVATATATFYAA